MRALACLGIYEIHLQGKCVSISDAPSAHMALLDYVSALGGREGDVLRLGSASLSWRGAVYTAVVAQPPQPPPDACADAPPPPAVVQPQDQSETTPPTEESGRRRARRSSIAA